MLVVLFFWLLHVNTLDISAIVPLNFTEDGLHFTVHFELAFVNISMQVLFHTNSNYTLVKTPETLEPNLCWCNVPGWVENEGVAIVSDYCKNTESSECENFVLRELEISLDLIDVISFSKFECQRCDELDFMGGGFFSEYIVTTASHDPSLNPVVSWENGFSGLPWLSPANENESEIIEFIIAGGPFLRWTNFLTLPANEYQWAESRYRYSSESIPNVFEVYDFSTCNTSLTGTHIKAVIDTSHVCLRLPAYAMSTLSRLLNCKWYQDEEDKLVGCYFLSQPSEFPWFTFSLYQNGPLFGINLEDLYIESSNKLCVIQTDVSDQENFIRFGTMAVKAFGAIAFDYKHSRVGFLTSDLLQFVYSSSLCNEIPTATNLKCRSYVLYDVNSEGNCAVNSSVLSAILGLSLTLVLLTSLNMGLRWLVEQNMTLTHA